ncbi:MAG: hypothetical protein CVT97_01550 [Bacteroidetes bacterium HGW-Bacteroidetes-14]|jgi:hypothetical protein|nr:MAG: hypothetical protein CVT97_01550 [Bacteroidetes bacterium HGW-Bacteroidetes-14]
MKSIFKISGVVLLTIFITIFTPGCEEEDTPDQMVSITVKMVNNSGDFAHMWVDGETIGAGNKLASGASRVVIVSQMSVALKWFVKCEAGRNGNVIDQSISSGVITRSQSVTYTLGADNKLSYALIKL